MARNVQPGETEIFISHQLPQTGFLQRDIIVIIQIVNPDHRITFVEQTFG